MTRPTEVTSRPWKPFECPYCHVTFEKDWDTVRFQPYPTFASRFQIRWAACSVCANPIVALEEETAAADELADFTTVRYLVRGAHVLWPQVFRGIDPLTGARDKKTFEGELRGTLEGARKTGDVVSLVYCDIDLFKTINDAHGHPVGDEVLRGYGALVDKRIGSKGTVYRIGGEEFAVLLPRFEKDVAAAQAESLRKHVEAARLASDAGGHALKVTSSFGVAAFPEDGGDAESLARSADAALYAAKQGGRNRVSQAPCRS